MSLLGEGQKFESFFRRSTRSPGLYGPLSARYPAKRYRFFSDSDSVARSRSLFPYRGYAENLGQIRLPKKDSALMRCALPQKSLAHPSCARARFRALSSLNAKK